MIAGETRPTGHASMSNQACMIIQNAGSDFVFQGPGVNDQAMRKPAIQRRNFGCSVTFVNGELDHFW